MPEKKKPSEEPGMNRREFIAKVVATTVVAAAAPALVPAGALPQAPGGVKARKAGAGGEKRGMHPIYPGDMPSDVFTLEVGGLPAPLSAVPGVPFAEYAALAAEYAALPSYCSINPSNYMGAHYAWLTAEGPVELTVTCPHPVKNCTVHPARRHVPTAIDGKTVRLTIGEVEPRYTIVEIDDYPPLVVIIDPPEHDAPRHDADDVLDLGPLLSEAKSVSERSAAFEDALRRATDDGKIAFVPAGVYHVGPIRLHGLQGARIYFAPGSLLRTEPSPAGKNVHSHGLWIQDCHNLRIWGRGCLDHGGFENFGHGRNNYNHGLISYYVTNDLCPYTTESPVFMLRCRNVVMEGLTVRNSRNFNFNIRRCDDVTFRRVKMLTPPASTPEYGDGFHTNSCVNVHIENCLAYCNDDCFACGHYTHFDDRDSGLHTVNGLVGWNARANGLRLGFHTYYNLGDFKFENCDLSGFVFPAIIVHPLKDAPEAHRFQRYGTVSFRNCGFDTDRLGDVLVDIGDARMECFEIVDSAFTTRHPMRIHGHAKDDGIKTVRLKGVTLGGEKLTPADLDLANVDKVEL